MAELLGGTYRVVSDDKNRLFGFFCTGDSAQVPAGRSVGAYPKNYIDFGLGTNPSKTGQGKGAEFLSFVIEKIEKSHPGILLRLMVAAFNKRAIHLYGKLGFQEAERFNNGVTEFITMVKAN